MDAHVQWIALLAYDCIFCTALRTNDTFTEQPFVRTLMHYLRSISNFCNKEITVSPKMSSFNFGSKFFSLVVSVFSSERSKGCIGLTARCGVVIVIIFPLSAIY